MSGDITIIERAEQHALCVSEAVGTMKLGKVTSLAYQEIMAHFDKHEIKCCDKSIPFTKYNNLDWEKLNKKGLFSVIDMLFFYKWEMDIGIPCPDSVPGEGRLHKMQLESGKYIRMIHTGPYKKVGNTYAKIINYAAEQSLEVNDFSIELYLNDPRETPTSQLETEVLVPIL